MLSVLGRRAFSTGNGASIVDVLQRRKLLYETTIPNTEALKDLKKVIYCGFDPTAPSLHVGHLVTLTTLYHFRSMGYKVLALIGGATGLIGDPSGRDSERPLAVGSITERNAASLKSQLTSISALSADGPELLVLNNHDWVKSISMLSFLRDIGRYFRLSGMLDKDSVSQRLNSTNGISYTEFSYQILQAYDFYHLHKTYGCSMQVGGQDQMGNIVAGIEFIHKKLGGSASAHGVTIPLITDEKGQKIGKSVQRRDTIWLDKSLTSSFEMYQFFLRMSDVCVEDMLKKMTLIPLAEIAQIMAEHEVGSLVYDTRS